jgi:Outer membrane lipoprotein carrier protein LolA
VFDVAGYFVCQIGDFEMKAWFACVLFLTGAAKAASLDVFAHETSADELAATLLVQPIKQIAPAKVLRAKFVHKKYLSDIPAPLESSGEMFFLRDKGLYWRTQKPFESVFVLTPTGAFQRDEGGAAVKVDAAQPAVRAAAGIFMALFSIDLKSLSHDFRLYGVPTGSGWQMGLKPKRTTMTAVFAQAVIRGAEQVQEIELTDSRGDRTVIRLVEVELLQRDPTSAERALLVE